MPVPNTFAGPYLDRVAHLRKDVDFVAGAVRDSQSLLVPVWRSRSLVRRDACGWSAGLVEVRHELRHTVDDDDLVMLGRFRHVVCFAVEVHGETPPAALPEATSFEDLRIVGGNLPADEAGLLAYARAMVLWRRRHRHCGTCGAPTTVASAGHVMRCSSVACGDEHFPRLDPAIIVLGDDGERALLGRQATWPAGRYSTIAGFVEPGESLEDAVVREVLEETGVTVVDARYHSSQPWPFPSSLMIGFTATAAPGAVAKADEELEDVRWFSRADIAAGGVGLPPPQSVSFRLIEDWYDSAATLALRRPRASGSGATRVADRSAPGPVGIEIAFVLAAAFGAGIVDAMAGGGGLIQLPALFAVFPNTPHPTLPGTGKLAGLAGTTSAAARFIRHVRIDWGLVLPAAAGAFVAALAGAWIATGISPARFRTLVPVLLAVVLLYTLLHKDFGRIHEPRRQGRHGSALAAATAGAIGLYDGFFGPGTGSFLVFLFVRVFGLDFLHASASAKIVNAAANLAAILLFGLTGKIFWLLGLAMAVCNVAGAQVGSHLAIRHGSGFVRAVFIAVVSCLIAKTAWDALALAF